MSSHSNIFATRPTWLLRWYFYVTATHRIESGEIRERGLRSISSRQMPLLLAGAGTTALAITALVLTGQLWPLAWLGIDLALVAARIGLIRRMESETRAFRESDHAWLMVGGLSWCVAFAIGSYVCAVSGQPAVVILAGVIAAGFVSGIASRNAATPRLALVFMLLCGVPWGVAVWGDHPPGTGWLPILVPAWIVSMYAVLLQNNRLLVRLFRTEIAAHERATIDQLTSLVNRTGFREIVDGSSRTLRGKNWDQLSVLCLDLDGFKSVNDKFGHMIGDLVLREVSMRIVDVIRSGDVACRTGGDEFVVFMPAASADTASDLACRLITAIGAPYAVDRGLFAKIGVSVGGATRADPQRTTEALLLTADVNLYEAKEAGRASYRDERGVNRAGTNVHYLRPVS